MMIRENVCFAFSSNVCRIFKRGFEFFGNVCEKSKRNDLKACSARSLREKIISRFLPLSATRLAIILARWADFFTPNSLISLSLKSISSLTSENFLKLSPYSSSSNLCSQSRISRCGISLAITIFFLLCDANRKLQLIPRMTAKMRKLSAWYSFTI